MGWRDLISTKEMHCILPWTGGRSLRSNSQTWTIQGRLPGDHGWYKFRIEGRKALDTELAEPELGILRNLVRGYLVGDRLIRDAAKVNPKPEQIHDYSERVYFIEDGLDRFSRIAAGRVHEDGPLLYFGQEFPMGAEDDVLTAYLDQLPSVRRVRGVTPALDAAFRMETWQRTEAERRRVELEQLRREEAERLAIEERRREIVEKLGDGAGRRELAAIDFPEAARAALAIGNAELLDVRDRGDGEKIVRYRLDGARYECICDERMQIIDSGICLQDHGTGEKGDTYFTLESLPAVIRQADREGKLVVYRHV